MTEYLLDTKYPPIKWDEIPADVEIAQAVQNVELYHNLIAHLILKRSFEKCIRPDIQAYEPFLSGHALPDMLNVGTGSVTVHEFLRQTNEDVEAVMQNLEIALTPLVDMFRDHQLSFAYDRLTHLSLILQDTYQEDDCEGEEQIC